MPFCVSSFASLIKGRGYILVVPPSAREQFACVGSCLVFFRSGLTKLRDWSSTLALFMDEYHVPLLDPTVAAFMGTGAELALPVLLVAGLFGRFAAAGLSVLNVVAVLSLADIPDAALQGHVFWGSLLAALLLWGPGALSLDRFAAPWLRARLTSA